jgi:Tol biopolymer transport system component
MATEHGTDGFSANDQHPVTVGLSLRSAALSAYGAKLAYSLGRWVWNLWRVPLLSENRATWADAERLTFDNALIIAFDVSPNGQQIVLGSDRAGDEDLWLLSLENLELTQLTVDPAKDWFPSWSPDGTQVVFYSYRSGNRDLDDARARWIRQAVDTPRGG